MRGGVLIVDDDEDFRDSYVDVLRLWGYQCVGIADGDSALAYLRRPDQTLPRLILLDLMMPGMNGWDFRAAQCADRTLAAIPVVVVTADLHQPRHGLGDVEVLSKLAPFDELLRLIRRHCGE